MAVAVDGAAKSARIIFAQRFAVVPTLQKLAVERGAITARSQRNFAQQQHHRAAKLHPQRRDCQRRKRFLVANSAVISFVVLRRAALMRAIE